MKRLQISIVMAVMTVNTLFLLSGCSVSRSSDTQGETRLKTVLETEISLNGETLKGNYEGDVLNGLPDGEGNFEVLDDSVEIKHLKGTFSKGKLSGEIEIEMTDGTVWTGKTSSGRYQGEIRAAYQDGTYQLFQYAAGIPIGQTVIYNSKNVPIGQNWYRKGVLLTDLIKDSKDCPIEELYNNPYYYSEEVVKFSGTADMVYQNNSECVLRISNSRGQSVFAVYKNAEFDDEFPVVVPLIVEGDTVTVYGTFDGIKENKYAFSGEDYGYSFPVISLFYAEKRGYKTDVFKRPQEPFDYTDILSNPYYFVGTKLKVDVVVENVLINYEENCVYCRSVTKEGDVYFVFLPWDKWIKKDKPLKGDRLSVLGTIAGNYIEESIDDNNEKCYRAYPLIQNVRVN